MRIKKCDHCLKPYQPQLHGINSVICDRCVPECEKAYHTIMKYVRQKSSEETPVTAEEAAKETAVPSEFFVALVKDGRFDNYKTDACNDEAKHQCKRCQEELETDDEPLCTNCMNVLTSSMQRHYQSPAQKILMSAQNNSETPRTTSKRTKGYGIGAK